MEKQTKKISLVLPYKHHSLKGMKELNDLCRLLVDPIGEYEEEYELMIMMNKKDWMKFKKLFEESYRFIRKEHKDYPSNRGKTTVTYPDKHTMEYVSVFGFIYLRYYNYEDDEFNFREN